MTDPTVWVYDDNKHDPEKHKRERVENGFSTYDWWNFNSYLAWVIKNGLAKFIDEGVGHPAHLTESQWKQTLGKIIDAFEAFEELESMESWDNKTVPYAEWAAPYKARWDEGSKLFIENFFSLWD